ncbi:MerR family transcriptional regulator [Pseudoalteromonas luteoviolacea]|uniref:Putative transcriptional regulator n=1 Tax=Pseudoalteromonas luteoviolacea (strain 2ta16) TaxID=1353533 RepID=V4HV88_PSEL2|nr:MerR family transcriptional regulator [Pseudoalteromonas luteoviolacea]ESP94750.1 putative transcriptional regulator [Pseudoalteromonas luteoviolacea 2ta16]
MYTVNQLGKMYDLSRSTLLYYDKIGLLKPSARSEANYRLYSNNDLKKMEKIATYREAGLSLESIADILNSDDTNSTTILEQRLHNLNSEISELRKQQQLVVELLGKDSLVRTTKIMNKEQWVNILRSSGMDEDDMHRWHREFERDLPEVHQDFLESLGCSPEEVSSIRKWSQ